LTERGKCHDPRGGKKRKGGFGGPKSSGSQNCKNQKVGTNLIRMEAGLPSLIIEKRGDEN